MPNGVLPPSLDEIKSLKRDQQVDLAAKVRFTAREGAEHFQSGDAVPSAERSEPARYPFRVGLL